MVAVFNVSYKTKVRLILYILSASDKYLSIHRLFVSPIALKQVYMIIKVNELKCGPQIDGVLLIVNYCVTINSRGDRQDRWVAFVPNKQKEMSF